MSEENNQKQERSQDPEVILVEFDPESGLKPDNLSEVAERSSVAIDKAMNAIRHMAAKTIESVNQLSDAPDSIEVQFGIKLDSEAGALVAKAGKGASLNVKLTWHREGKAKEKSPYVTGLVPRTQE